jgi:hypothetical protein
LVALAAPFASGQIIEERSHNGKIFECARSGLISYDQPCGADPWFETIFLGSIVSIKQVGDEKRVRLRPQEIFSGTPEPEVEAMTSQGECLDDLKLEDRWLVYLRRDEKTHELLLAYGWPGGPEAMEGNQVALLRRLASMDKAGLIRGNITGPWFSKLASAANQRVVAVSMDQVKRSAVVDADGGFEFEPVPPGKYDLRIEQLPGMVPEVESVEVKAHSCDWVRLEQKPDGTISGRVVDSKGLPVKELSVEAVTESGEGIDSAETDDKGHFEVHGLSPGRYWVGLNIYESFVDPKTLSVMYYPGVADKNAAKLVELGIGEKQTGIDLQVPPGAKLEVPTDGRVAGDRPKP